MHNLGMNSHAAAGLVVLDLVVSMMIGNVALGLSGAG